MKKIIGFAIAVMFASVVYAQTPTQQTPTQQTPAADIAKVIDFKETDHDFGKIPYGKPVEFTVEMKNLSSDSVTIQNVQVGCGCTTPKWKPGPYAPGQAFNITIGFNGYTKGQFQKTVTIFFEGGLNKLIRFHGETFEAPENAAPQNGAVQKLKSADKS